MNKIFAIASATVLSAVIMSSAVKSSEATLSPLQTGALLYHNYSAYGAMDSTLRLYDFSSDEISDISSPDYIHAMNGDFGSHRYDIVFMAIDKSADEWDIYRYNAISGNIENLTQNSGYRNEDPKFSPDGQHIIFKRGYWSSETDGFVYDLAELDLTTREITMLTNDIYEDSMPYYSSDGETVYYARVENSLSGIYSLDLETRISTPVYAGDDKYAYYPTVYNDSVYFTAWYSSENHSDAIMKFSNGKVTALPFDSPDYNSSDPFVFGENQLIYSSTENGNYDIFCYDNDTKYAISKINTELQELGSAYFSESDAEKVAVSASDFLLGCATTDENFDADGDGVVTSFDLVYLRQQ